MKSKNDSNTATKWNRKNN